MRLRGATAVIVGVGSAIGREAALVFAREGAAVLAVDPDATVAESVAAAVRAAGGAADAIAADVAGREGAAQVAARCAALWGRLDVLFACAAREDYWAWGSPEDTDAGWADVLGVNLLGPVAYTRALAPLLARSGAGSIVYLGSIDGFRGNPNTPAYSIAKGGLVPFTHVMADRLAADGIRVNLIATGAIHQGGTGARPRVDVPNHVEIAIQTPLGRRATPEDVAAAALFLASRESSYVTGTVLTVDGGRTAVTPGTSPRAYRTSG